MTTRNAVAMGALLTLSSAQVFAGTAPSEPVPIVSELGMLGMSLILAGFAARFIAKRIKRS